MLTKPENHLQILKSRHSSKRQIPQNTMWCWLTPYTDIDYSEKMHRNNAESQQNQHHRATVKLNQWSDYQIPWNTLCHWMTQYTECASTLHVYHGINFTDPQQYKLHVSTPREILWSHYKINNTYWCQKYNQPWQLLVEDTSLININSTE